MNYTRVPHPVPDPLQRIKRRVTVAVAAVLVVAQVTPAYATIDNTATATGSSPSGTGDVTDSDTENVDVIDAAPATTVDKVMAFAPGGDVNGDTNFDIGDTVQYTYTVTNSGNVTLQNVALTDAHDGVGAALVFTNPASYTDNGTNPGGPTGTLLDSSNTDFTDGDWDVLGPQDVIVFTSTYTLVAGDFTAGTSADGDIDNTATVNASYNAAPITASTDSEFVPLDAVARFDLVKVADDTTDRDVGDIVAYTYTLTNTGNVPITAITLADVENGSGALVGPTFSSFTIANGSTNAGNTITLFNPGAVAEYTSTYQVTQNDVDTLQ